MRRGFPSVGWHRCLRRHVNKTKAMGKGAKVHPSVKLSIMISS